MKRAIFLLVALLLVVSAMPAMAASTMPNGEHYNLNIIGVEKPKSANFGEDDYTNSNGRRIFVALRNEQDTFTKISLIQGDTFDVLDYNGTDGEAKFQLPVPATCSPDATSCEVTYQVWARALGTPGGSSTMRTCATEVDPNTTISGTYCSVEEFTVKFVRDPGRPKWMDVTKELLFLSWDIDADTVLEHVPLFYTGWDNWYWEYVNSGLRLAQLRFYPVKTTVIW